MAVRFHCICRHSTYLLLRMRIQRILIPSLLAIQPMIGPQPSAALTMQNQHVSATIEESSGALKMIDRTTARSWGPDPWEGAAGLLHGRSAGTNCTWNLSKAGPIIIRQIDPLKAGVEFCDGGSRGVPLWSIAMEIGIAPDEGKLTVRLDKIVHADGLLLEKLLYPYQVLSLRTDRERGAAVLPYWQGVIIPSYIFPMNGGRFCTWDDDQHGPSARGELTYYGWDGLVMPWFGIHDDKSAAMTVVPYDGSVGVQWIANYNDYAEVARRTHSRTTLPRILALTPIWNFPEAKTGTAISCHLLPGADHVGMAKRYRRIAQENGMLVTLRDKAKANRDVEKLRGAIYTGIYGGYPHYVNMEGMAFDFEELDAIIRNMHEAQNVPRALIHAWGTFQNYAPKQWPISEELGGPVTLQRVVRRAKSYGWLFSAYHSFVSLLDHDPNFDAGLAPKDTQGRPVLGPRWKAVDENRWVELAKAVLPKEIEAIGQNADITDIAFTGKVGESGRALAEYLASTGLVLGTERGNEWLVSKYHMFEGMVAPYRDRPLVRYSHPAPLFNLVYHDAIVNFGKIQDPNQLALNPSGDYYVKTLRAMLYGDGPMVFFSPYEYDGIKPYLRFAAEFLCPLHESIGFEEMTDHAYLSEDGLVQRSKFANGVEVRANLGPTPWASPLDGDLPAYGFRIKRADGSTFQGRFRHSVKIGTRDWDF